MSTPSLSIHCLFFVQDFESVDPRCPVYVRNAFNQILSLAQQGTAGTICVHTVHVCLCACVCMHSYIYFVLQCMACTCTCRCILIHVLHCNYMHIYMYVFCTFMYMCMYMYMCTVHVQYTIVLILPSHRASDHYRAVPPMWWAYCR